MRWTPAQAAALDGRRLRLSTPSASPPVPLRRPTGDEASMGDLEATYVTTHVPVAASAR